MAFSIFRKNARIITAAAAVIFFVLFAAAGGSRPVSFIRAYAIRMLSPVADAGEYAAGYLTGAPRRDIRGLEVEDGRRRLAAAEAQALALWKENESLQRLLGLKESAAAAMVSARVLAYTNIMGMETLLIDAGADQGIREGDIAIDGNRLLVGRVSEVNDAGAKVSVASNAGTAFSALLLPLGGEVLASGRGGRAFSLELIPHDTPVRDGDMVLWASEQRRGDPAIFAGRVVKGMRAATGAFRTAGAVLLSDPETLEHLLVIIGR